MAGNAEQVESNTNEPRPGNGSPGESHSAESSKDQRSLLEKRISGPNREKRIEAALLFISGFQTSPTRLAEKFGVSKNTVLRWKKRDGWTDLATQTDAITRASLPDSVAAYRVRMIRSLEEDLELIDRKKEGVKPNSLEGLLKAKAALQGRLHELLGIATEKDRPITIVFGGYGEPPAARGPVRVPGKEIPVETEETPGIGTLGNPENTEDPEGGKEAPEGGKGDSIEISRGNVENSATAPSKGASSAGGSGGADQDPGERPDTQSPLESDGEEATGRVALRGRKLRGGKTETKEGLSLEEALS